MPVAKTGGTVVHAGAQVREAERLLRAAGHAPRLKAALARYQRAVGLAATGELTGRTLEQLRKTGRVQANHGDKYVSLGMRGGDIRTMEARLAKLGYDVGKVDGVYSRQTYAAAKAFKADQKAIASTSGGLGAPAQELLARLAARKGGKVPDKGDTGRDTNVRAVAFNWPSRYKKGGQAADEALFERLATKADVMGLSEFKWANPGIAGRKKNWGFYHPDPQGDGASGKAGQMVAWRKDKFTLVEKGTSLLNKRTKIQQKAAGPTIHSEKSVIWTKLRDKKTGEVWTVAAVHFVPSKHLGGAAEALWRQQRDALAAWMSKQGPRTIVMGDFNGQWKDGIARPLHRVARAQTAPSHGKRAIDWILRSKDLQAKTKGQALSHGGQSDHRPVRGVVRG